MRAVAIARRLPEHAAAEPQALHVGHLVARDGRGIVRDELARAVVVAVDGLGDVVVHLDGPGLGQLVVVVGIGRVVVRGGGRGGEGRAEAGGVGKGAPVDGHAEDELVGRDAALDVVADGRVGGAVHQLRVGVQVGEVAAGLGPGAGKVVGHEVDVVEDGAELGQLQLVVGGGAGGRGNGQLEAVAGGRAGGVGVELVAQRLQQEHHVGGLLGVLRVLPVEVDAVEAPVADELDGRPRKGEAGGVGGGHGRKRRVLRPGPAADGDEQLHVPVGLFEQEQLLDGAVDVGRVGFILGCRQRELDVDYTYLCTVVASDLQSPG